MYGQALDLGVVELELAAVVSSPRNLIVENGICQTYVDIVLLLFDHVSAAKQFVDDLRGHLSCDDGIFCDSLSSWLKVSFVSHFDSASFKIFTARSGLCSAAMR